MKILLIGVIIFGAFQVAPAIAEEGYMCSSYYENVQRKKNNITSYGSDLSSMAKIKLFDDLKFDTEQCISECEGEKFKYCNKIAKWISK
jgi:hypothetical protein